MKYSYISAGQNISRGLDNLWSNGVVVIRVNPVNEWHAIASARAHKCPYLFRHAIVAHAKLDMTS